MLRSFFILMFLLSSSVLFGNISEEKKDSLVAEKLNFYKIRGKYFRYEPLCSRTYKIKFNHRITYKGGCESNKDSRKTGHWTIQNDTLIITNLWGEQQKWILVNGCFYRVNDSTKTPVACRRSKQK